MIDDDFRPRRPAPEHEIGQKLDALSVEDLSERIALLRQEIERLEAARSAKQTALEAAGAFFKPR